MRGSVAELNLGGQPGVFISGHRFSCNWKQFSDNITRCRTILKGKPLEVEFTLNLEGPLGCTDSCNLRYDDRNFLCNGFKDYRHKKGQVDLDVENPLDLTEFDRWWVLLNNPLANFFGNISEIDWDRLLGILPWVISSLIGVGIWLDLRRVSILTATLLSPLALVLTPVIGWFTALVLILTGQVD